MPYISKDRRPELLPIVDDYAESEGELNFQISSLLNEYMVHHGLSYDRMGDCVAACMNAAGEFQRRVMDPYEDTKIESNGDVYDPSVVPWSPWRGRSAK